MSDLFCEFSAILAYPRVYREVTSIRPLGSGEYAVTVSRGIGVEHSRHTVRLIHLRVKVGVDEYRNATADDVSSFTGE